MNQWSINPYAQCLIKFNKIKLYNQKNVQISIVRKSFQQRSDKPKVSAIENVDKKMMTIQMVIEKWPRKEKFSRLQSWKLNEDNFSSVTRNENIVYLKNATTIWSSEDIGVGSL